MKATRENAKFIHVNAEKQGIVFAVSRSTNIKWILL
jgi:hypothetical protein